MDRQKRMKKKWGRQGRWERRERERQIPWRCKVNTSSIKKYSNSQAEESLRIPKLFSEDEYYSEISLNEGGPSEA